MPSRNRHIPGYYPVVVSNNFVNPILHAKASKLFDYGVVPSDILDRMQHLRVTDFRDKIWPLCTAIMLVED